MKIDNFATTKRSYFHNLRSIKMRSKPGYTFVEVIFVIALVGIFSAIAIPRFYNIKKLSYTTTRELISDLRTTRGLAIGTGVSHYLQLGEIDIDGLFSPSSSPYTGYAIFDSSNNQIGETRAIPDGVDCNASTDTFTFNYLGSCDSDSTIALDGEGETHTINIVGITGRASTPLD
jgi:prepilin-type N-terminal cleavage/methylation domain-containing protein